MTQTIRLIAVRPVEQKKRNAGLLVSMVLLFGFGLITLYAASESYALRAFNDPFYFVKRQAVSMVLGGVALLVASQVDIEFVRRKLPLIVIGTLLLCLLPFVPGIGAERNGARRWISIGTFGTFQPSELAKIAVVLFLANLFDKRRDQLDDPSVSVYPAAVGLFSFVLVIFLQNDFSTAIFILELGFVIFFLAGVQLRWFFAFCVFAIPVAVLVVFREEYRVNRLIAFLRPDYDVLGINYQLIASMRAIGAGGLWGNGLGTGLHYVQSIPEVQADFIFAGWVESMGFFGVVLYFALLIVFFVAAMQVGLCARDRFRSLLVVGIAVSIFVQSLLNCGVVSGALPSTGIPLPFFSSGGSSVLCTMLGCGLILNVSQNPGKEAQYG